MLGRRLATTSRLKWASVAACTWLAISSALPAALLTAGGHGTIFFLPALLQGFVGAVVHAAAFCVLPARFLASYSIAVTLAASAFVGGILLSAARTGGSPEFFIEGGAIVLAVIASLGIAPALVIRRLFATVSSAEPRVSG